jgi:hypothetical protein
MKFKSETESDYDDETGLHHMAHVACNAMFLVWYALKGGGTDDRYKGEPDAESKVKKIVR